MPPLTYTMGPGSILIPKADNPRVMAEKIAWRALDNPVKRGIFDERGQSWRMA